MWLVSAGSTTPAKYTVSFYKRKKDFIAQKCLTPSAFQSLKNTEKSTFQTCMQVWWDLTPSLLKIWGAVMPPCGLIGNSIMQNSLNQWLSQNKLFVSPQEIISKQRIHKLPWSFATCLHRWSSCLATTSCCPSLLTSVHRARLLWCFSGPWSSWGPPPHSPHAYGCHVDAPHLRRPARCQCLHWCNVSGLWGNFYNINVIK